MISKDSFYSKYVDRKSEGMEFKRHPDFPGRLESEKEIEFRSNFPSGYLRWVTSFFNFLHAASTSEVVAGAQKYKSTDYTTLSLYFTTLELRELKLNLK